jgi:hypothetical protein
MSDSAPVSVLPGAAPGAQTPAAAGSAARNFLVQLEQALANIVTLKVVTLVGTVDVTGAGAGARVAIVAGTPLDAASTEVNLLDGHITNTFSAGFGALANGEMRNFHESQVEKSQAIVTGNLAEIQKLATALIATVRR